MKKIKKIIAFGVVFASITSTVAFAKVLTGSDTCALPEFDGDILYGYLDTVWPTGKNNTATARTTHSSNNYYTATYLEATTYNNDVLQHVFKYGAHSSSAYLSSYYAQRFNSTHGLVSKDNVNQYIMTPGRCTDQ